MKRIAMISFHTCPLAALGGKKTGGMNVYVREVARQLAHQGMEVDVFTRCRDPRVDKIVPLSERARVIHIPAGPMVRCGNDHGWLYVSQFARGILGFMTGERTHYDIIHSHYWLSGWTGLRLCRDLQAPLVHMFHTLGVMKNRVAKSEAEKERALRIALEKRVVRLSRMLVASSPADRAHMVWHYGADPAKIEVVPCGVDLSLFTPLSKNRAKARLGLSSRRLILFVGRIQPIKGLDCLLKALAILLKRSRISSKDLHLLIVGGNLDSPSHGAGGELEKLKALTTHLGLDSMVTFLGAQPQHVLPYFYSAAEMCVLPSRYESFGLVALEAMACGTPVIASRVGGLNYTIRDGKTGFLVPEGNALVLADTIDHLLQDRSLQSLMGRQGVQHARRYSWENIARQIVSLYDRVLSRGVSTGLELRASPSEVTEQKVRPCLGSS